MGGSQEILYIMIGSTLKRLGCCGVLVWLAIAGTFATFFIGEYLERPEEDKTFWKAGVQAQHPVIVLSVSVTMYILQGIYCVGSILGTGAGLSPGLEL